jgi:GMP synthase-like glutamine amidotransferase
MIASALGAVVYKNQEPEMGFFPVTFNQNAQNDPVFRHFPTELSVMHFHFDTFELPEGAVAMAKSTVTPIQAFRYGSNVFALQFHCELTETNAPVFINELASEIIPGTYVQQPAEMLQNIEDCMPNNFIFFRVLDEILYLTPAKILFRPEM